MCVFPKMTQFISLSYLNGIHKSRTLLHILEHLCNIFIFIFNLLYIPFYKSPPTIKQNMLFFFNSEKSAENWDQSCWDECFAQSVSYILDLVPNPQVLRLRVWVGSWSFGFGLWELKKLFQAKFLRNYFRYLRY